MALLAYTRLMNRKLVLLLALWAPLMTSVLAKPNIVVILADDLGYGDLGCYNPDSKIPTPRLDQLSREGMRFTDAHAPASVCSPTRYSLLTGRYAWRSRLKSGVLKPWDPPLIEKDRLTLGQFLREQGYSTACIGKWHLGWTWPTKNAQAPSSGPDRLSNVDFAQPIADGPITRGFDYYFGVDLPNYPPYCFIENDRVTQTPSMPDSGKADGFNRPGPMAPGWKMVDVLPEISRRAEAYVADAAKAERPFFLFLALPSPHYPVVPAPEFRGKSGAGEYGDFVAQTDATVGGIMDAIKRAGVESNTLLIFSSDNGPEITGEVRNGVYDRAKDFGHFSMGPLRGAKRDAWEGGHRVPFLARWPGQIPAATRSDETICQVDLMATIAAIVGAKLPPAAGEDSVNILPALRQEPRSTPLREATIHPACAGCFAIRQGDWVLIDGPTGDDNGKVGEPEWFKKLRGYSAHSLAGELYNLKEDLAQARNRYAEQPERVQAMRALLLRIQSADAGDRAR